MSAQATPKVSKRQAAQHVRIADGVRSGELTRLETANVRQDQRELRRMKRAAKSDGVVTRGERAQLHAKQNSNSRKITRKKNNGRSRY